MVEVCQLYNSPSESQCHLNSAGMHISAPNADVGGTLPRSVRRESRKRPSAGPDPRDAGHRHRLLAYPSRTILKAQELY